MRPPSAPAKTTLCATSGAPHADRNNATIAGSQFAHETLRKPKHSNRAVARLPILNVILTRMTLNSIESGCARPPAIESNKSKLAREALASAAALESAPQKNRRQEDRPLPPSVLVQPYLLSACNLCC
jgi:hypothetical protein